MKRPLLLAAAAAALLAATETHAQPPIVPGEVTRGTLQRGDPRIPGGGYYNDYLFEGRRGETVIVALHAPSFDAFLYLGMIDRGRYVEVARDDDGGGGTHARLEVRLPESGTYVVRASSLTQATGPYVLTLAGGRAPADARGGYDRPGYDDRGGYDRPGYEERYDARGGPIRAGTPAHGRLSTTDPTLDNGAPFHLYTYYARRGERVTITLRSTDFDANLVMGTRGGRHGIQNALARNDDFGGTRDSRIDYTFQNDGEFVIRVNPVLSGFGRYTLEVVSDR